MMDNQRQNGNGNKPPEKPTKFRFTFGSAMLIVVAIGVIISLGINYLSGSGLSTTISYSSFKDNLAANNISSITVQGEKITGTFKTPPVSSGLCHIRRSP